MTRGIAIQGNTVQPLQRTQRFSEALTWRGPHHAVKCKKQVAEEHVVAVC